MSNFAVDGNRNIAAIRTGALIGGTHGLTAPAEDTWFRLMPNTDSASKVANNNTAIDLGALRADILDTDISGWYLRVLTSGYENLYTIAEYDATTEVAQLEIYGANGNISENVARLPATFDVVYYPQMLLPLTLRYVNAEATPANHPMRIGYAITDAISPTIVGAASGGLTTLASGDQLIMPVEAIDKLFFLFPEASTAGVVYSISWGEQYVS